MKVLLGSQDLWEIVQTGYDEPTTEAERIAAKDSSKKNQKALLLIFQGVDEALFEKVSGATTAKAAWEILHKVFQGVDKAKQVRLQSLRAEYNSLRMSASESIIDYTTKLQTVVNEMRRNGEKLEDIQVMEKLMGSVHRRFNFVVASINESKNLSTYTIEELIGSLQAYEMKMNQDDEFDKIDQAFQTKVSIKDEPGSSSSQGRGRGFRGRGRSSSNQSNCGGQSFQGERGNQPWQSNSGARGRGRGYRGRGRGGSFQRRDKSDIQC